MRHKSNRGKKFTTQLLEKFIISRPQGTSVRSIEAYHFREINNLPIDYVRINRQIIVSGGIFYLRGLTDDSR